MISENINEMLSGDTLGVYDGSLDKIVLKRSVLSDSKIFYEVLFHELAHATSKYQDNTREFENELGKIIGNLAFKLIPSESMNLNDDGSSPGKKMGTESILSHLQEGKSGTANSSGSKEGDPKQKKTHTIFGRRLI